MSALAWFSIACAALPAGLFIRNLSLYRTPGTTTHCSEPVSVLIPARNEEANIGEALEAILENSDVEFEVVVLDDHSSDRTAAIVRAIAAREPRVRLESAPELPKGWGGKQHACWVLAERARNPVLMFVDADVRLSSDAIGRLATFLQESGSGLISGIPRQITITPLEALLIPLVHFVLLGFLPISRMRVDLTESLGAGCGQLFLAKREGYFRAGGHRGFRGRIHDGIHLPRAFRRAGMMTDLCDVTQLAACRMYRSAGEVWGGLLKNATEGLASKRLIVPMTVVLFSGQVLPALLVAKDPRSFLAWTALLLAVVPRLLAARRFVQPWWSAALQPLSVGLFLVLQWHAFIRERLGRRSQWRGRTVEVGTSAGS